MSISWVTSSQDLSVAEFLLLRKGRLFARKLPSLRSLLMVRRMLGSVMLYATLLHSLLIRFTVISSLLQGMVLDRLQFQIQVR